MTFSELRSNADWSKWDSFVMSNHKANFVMYSFWLEMYCLVPFLIKKIGYVVSIDNKIMGGISGIKVGWSFFSYVIFPSGPTFINDQVQSVSSETFIKMVLSHQKIRNAIQVQISSLEKLDFAGLKVGKRIKLIYLSPGLGIIPLKDDADTQLSQMKAKVRRDIRQALNRGLSLEKVTRPDQLKDVYRIFKQNSIDAGYKIRPYFFLEKGWIASMHQNYSHFFLVSYQNEFKGAIWAIEAGGMFNYVMGGSSKEIPSLNIGYFLQWKMIELSISKKYSLYNISIGGSPGVEKFKIDFGRISINNTFYYLK